MAEELVTMLLWGLITIASLAHGFINYECAYIGMCMMLAAGLLHKEE